MQGVWGPPSKAADLLAPAAQGPRPGVNSEHIFRGLVRGKSVPQRPPQFPTEPQVSRPRGPPPRGLHEVSGFRVNRVAQGRQRH